MRHFSPYLKSSTVALERFIKKLNDRPIIWTLSLGITIYFCAFWLAVLGMLGPFPLSFESGFISAGMLVMTYHWLMSRYIIESKTAQLIQITFGFCLISLSMFLIGAMMHEKAYEWLNAWL